MTYTNDKEIGHIGHGLLDRTLPKSEWTHTAHFAAAIWLLANEDDDVFRNMPMFIRRYNEATGVQNTDTEGYHETITIASLRAAKFSLDKAPPETPLYEIVNNLILSEFGKPPWLFSYWSKPLLFSAKARREWVGPDLQGLPF